MKKLNEIVNTCKVTVHSFPAFKGLEGRCNQTGEPATIATVSPAIMLDMGIDTYYAPAIPRNAVYNSTDDVIAADLDVNLVHVKYAPEIAAFDQVIIVSRHPGTVDTTKAIYSHNVVFDSITPDIIRDKKVVGTLPPTLIQYAAAYKPVTIKDFDYAKDGDLTGTALWERMVIGSTIRVTIE